MLFKMSFKKWSCFAVVLPTAPGSIRESVFVWGVCCSLFSWFSAEWLPSGAASFWQWALRHICLPYINKYIWYPSLPLPSKRWCFLISTLWAKKGPWKVIESHPLPSERVRLNHPREVWTWISKTYIENSSTAFFCVLKDDRLHGQEVACFLFFVFLSF